MNKRDMKDGLLVTAMGVCGIVAYWNNQNIFVRYWDQKKGCFEESAAATDWKQVTQGGAVSWGPPPAKPEGNAGNADHSEEGS